jgi:CxxC motif-containing protein
MIKKMTCIACPIGCQLEVDVEGGRAIKITGNKCEKGPIYAKQEIENPTRILTASVLTDGLNLKILPVRTSKAIPKNKLGEAMEAILKIKISKPVKVGSVLVNNFLDSGVDLIATREAEVL